MRVALTHNLKRTSNEAEAEFDTAETIAALRAAVESAGHQVIPMEVSRPLEQWLAELSTSRPDVILNTAEGTRGAERTALFPAVFAALNLRFTGSDARVQMLTQDKYLTKLCVSAEGVSVPRGLLVSDPCDHLPLMFDCPVIVKPNFEGSSRGITDSSVILVAEKLSQAVAKAISDFPSGVLVEEYIPGTDVAVGYFEGLSQEILTPCSYLIAPEWANRHRLYDFRLKNVAPDEAVQVACPARIPDAALDAIRSDAAKVVKALCLRGVARLDFRVRDDGKVFFVEANATPSLEPGSSLFVALQSQGVDYNTAIAHLINHAH